MARVFRQTYTKRGSKGRKIVRQTRNFYVEYRDADGILRRVPGYTDRKATEQLAAELERKAARVKSGLLDRCDEQIRRPLSEHLDEWRTALLAKGNTEKHADLMKQRVKRVLEGTHARFWPDLSASRVQEFLADLRADTEEKRGLSIQSTNYHLQAVKQFCKWMVRDGRAPVSPMEHLQALNPRTDRRHDRRALPRDELIRLLSAAQNGPARYGMQGPERALLYRLAVETGLRASELRSLNWSSFDLDSNLPTVTVKACYSKHRREDTLPLRPSTACKLKAMRDAVPQPQNRAVFTMPAASKISEMLREDLDQAKIPYELDGKFVDFHALRHTFITNLARGGVYPKVAQALARHSTITLTMDRYSHTVVGEQALALEALPDLPEIPAALEPPPDVPETPAAELEVLPEENRTTTSSLPFGLPEFLPVPVAARRVRPAALRIIPATAQGINRIGSPAAGGTYRIALRPAASICTPGSGKVAMGFEPMKNGFAIRSLSPLGHATLCV